MIRSLCVVVAAGALACEDDRCAPPAPGAAPEHLCAWGLFVGTGAEQVPAAGVHAYDVIAPLFADGAEKLRFFRLPPRATIGYTDAGTWEFPVGAVIAKTFALPRDDRDPGAGRRLIETRVLVHEVDGWRPHLYRWNDAQTDATRFVPGTRVRIPRIDAAGAAYAQEYRIPGLEDCWTCHARGRSIGLLGLRTHQLSRPFARCDDQVDELHALGLLSTPPTPAGPRPRLLAPFGAGELVARARSYLDGNCAHCHREGGDASSSGLWLGAEVVDDWRLGVCKAPTAAGSGTGGLDHDIVPGSPDRSVLAYRMAHAAPDVHMPELGALQVDDEGLALVRRWIAGMSPADCDLP